KHVVGWNELSPTTSAVAVAAKGGPVAVEQHATAPESPLPSGVVLSLGGGVARSIADGLGVSGALRVGVEPTHKPGPTVSLLGTLARTDQFAEEGVQGRVGYRYAWDVSRFWFGLGGEIGGGVVVQSYSGTVATAAGASSSASGIGVLAARGTARV